jgi:phage-related protein
METMTKRLPEIVTLGADLVIGVINGLAEKVPEFVTAVVGLIVAFIDGLADNIELIIEAGANLIISFIEGIGKNSLKIIDAGFDTLVTFLEGLADSIRKNKKRLTDAGKDILDAIFGGIIEGAEPVIKFFTELPGRILGWLAGFGTLLYNKGKALLTGIKNGIDFGVTAVNTFFSGLPGKILGWVGKTSKTLFTKGWNFLVGLYNGVIGFVNEKLMPWFSKLPSKVAGWIKNASTALVTVGKNLVIGLWNGIHSKFYGWMKGKLGYLWNLIPGWIKSALGIRSPSRVMMKIGEHIGDGLGIGMYSTQRDLYRAASSMSTAVTEGFDVDPKELTNPIRDAVRDAVSMMDDMDDLNPTITPVLDLSKVQKDASGLNGLLGNQKVTAKAIALTRNQPVTNTESVEASSGNVMFEQNIYSPKELSAAEIYRQTRNQITIAKEELDVR